ncbi:lipopolysaccharide biosynthesis protein [Thioalkalivibrio sulfidiphilus]|uniref:lipopolysaccharide biosynthesis protein n=1 Tax=Thioalkalivibrio sulfidiphilus TaxID=1033854 RepID=UPI003BB0B950
MRNVAVVASGTAGAQAITMVFAPIITRLYGPEAFGLLGTFMAIVSVIVPIAALAYPIAIVLPKEDSDAKGLVRLSLGISAGIAAVAFLAFGLKGEWILSSVGASEIADFALLIPVVILFSAWLQIAQQWLIRQQAFKETARATIAYSFILNSAKSGAGLFYPFASVLISLQAIGIALHAILLVLAARLSIVRRPLRWEENPPQTSLALAYRYRDFPFYRAPQNFINAASKSIPTLLLATMVGPTAAGLYVLGQMVLGAPLQLIAKSVGDVFYPKFTNAVHVQKPLIPLLWKATAGLAVIGVIPFGLLVILGPLIFELVFGSDWRAAGEYARWLAIMYFVGFMNTPAVAATATLGLQRGLVIYEIASTGLKVIAMYIGFVAMGSDVWAIALLGIFGAISYVGLIVWVFYEAQRVERAVVSLSQGK